MRKTLRSAFALLLAVLMVGSLGATAFADNPGYVYTDGQFYEADDSQESFYTVQVSAGPNKDGAERVRSYMLSKGFDSFVYEVDGLYRIMCGKFEKIDDAYLYCELIYAETDRQTAYVTEALLPASAREDFLANLKHDPLIVGKAMYNGWEDPTGAFLDMTANEEETELIYTVQYSGGNNFNSAERRRDELIDMGYDATVVKLPGGCYLVLTGSFATREEARSFLDEIWDNTSHWRAGVREIRLPASALK